MAQSHCYRRGLQVPVPGCSPLDRSPSTVAPVPGSSGQPQLEEPGHTEVGHGPSRQFPPCVCGETCGAAPSLATANMKSKFDSGSGGCELGAGNHGRVSPLAASIASGTQGPGTGTPSDIITSTHEERGRRGAATHNQKRGYNNTP